VYQYIAWKNYKTYSVKKVKQSNINSQIKNILNLPTNYYFFNWKHKNAKFKYQFIAIFYLI